MPVEITKLKVLILNDGRPNYAIASACGIHPSTLSLYALGKKGMSQKHLLALCKEFQCEPEDLVGTVSFTL